MKSPPRDDSAAFVPGAVWRILARDGKKKIALENQGIFDELVIDQWLHLEQMDANNYWLRVGDARVSICVRGPDDVDVTVERDVY